MTTPDRTDPPLFETSLWPHRSLPRKGFVWLIGMLCALVLIPMLAFLGHRALWVILIMVMICIGALWYFIERNYTDGTVHENIKIWHDLITVERVNPRAPDQHWQANPHWVELHIKDTKETQSYLTVTGGNREIELGAFLTPAERIDLRYRLEKEIRAARTSANGDI